MMMPLCHYQGKNIWLLKPTCMNRGNGIHVFSSFKKLKKLVRDYCKKEDPLEGIINKFKLQAPFMMVKLPNFSSRVDLSFKNTQSSPYSFTIASLTSECGSWSTMNNKSSSLSKKHLLHSFFREGYLRTSSSEYSTDRKTLEDGYIHLTNNAVQKNAPNYGNFEDGNQLSFAYFREYLKMVNL